MPGFSIQANSPRDVNNKAEFHRDHRWAILSLGIPAGGGATTTRTKSEDRLWAQSVQLPSLKFDEEKIKSGASLEYKIAKKANWQDMTVKFYDVYGLYKKYEEWQRKIWSQEQGIGRADQYKGRVIVQLTDGTGQPKQTYTAFGAYPKSITHGDLSYTSHNIKLLTVVYSYDYATVEFK